MLHLSEMRAAAKVYYSIQTFPFISKVSNLASALYREQRIYIMLFVLDECDEKTSLSRLPLGVLLLVLYLISYRNQEICNRRLKAAPDL